MQETGSGDRGRPHRRPPGRADPPRAVLRLKMDRFGFGNWFELDGLPLVSRRLTRIELHGLGLRDNVVDFSSCPALEDLRIYHSAFLTGKRISSQSLRRLTISYCIIFDRIRIYSPNVVSLKLYVSEYRTPILERMPSLVNAAVNINFNCKDSCHRSYSGDCDDQGCDACYCRSDDTNNSVLLQGLSEAKDLELLSQTVMFIFRRDLKCCPTFTKLKTLLLNEYWCVPADLSALACILEHAPVLEKLTLQLFSKGPKHKVEIKGIPPSTRNTICNMGTPEGSRG